MALRISPPSRAISRVKARVPAGRAPLEVSTAGVAAGAAAAGPLPSALKAVKTAPFCGLPPGPTVSSIRASAVTGGRHCESLQA